MIVIDREAVVGFRSNEEKKQTQMLLVTRFDPVLARMRDLWSEPEAMRSWKTNIGDF